MSLKKLNRLCGDMCKTLLVAALVTSVAYADNQISFKDGAEIYPMRPDGQRDWGANYYRFVNGEAVPIRPDGQRDWKINAYRSEVGGIIPFRPDGQRDWNASAGTQ